MLMHPDLMCAMSLVWQEQQLHRRQLNLLCACAAGHILWILVPRVHMALEGLCWQMDPSEARTLRWQCYGENITLKVFLRFSRSCLPSVCKPGTFFHELRFRFIYVGKL